jgi:hypothetical protein
MALLDGALSGESLGRTWGAREARGLAAQARQEWEEIAFGRGVGRAGLAGCGALRARIALVEGLLEQLQGLADTSEIERRLRRAEHRADVRRDRAGVP